MGESRKKHHRPECYSCGRRTGDPDGRTGAHTFCTPCRSHFNSQFPKALSPKHSIEITGSAAYLLAAATQEGLDLTDLLAEALRQAIEKRTRDFKAGLNLMGSMDEPSREEEVRSLREKILEQYSASTERGEKGQIAQAAAEFPELFPSASAVKQAAAERRGRLTSTASTSARRTP